MAAWRARVESVPAVAGDNPDEITIGIGYYLATDAGFTNQLAFKLHYFNAQTDKNDLVTAVKDWGIKMRNAQAARDAALAIAPAGQTINIP